MKIIEPSYEILSLPSNPLQLLELAARTCYKSEDRMGPGTDVTMVQKILDSQHESVIEHASMTVKFICDRGVSHELVRHRLASFSQESTRYCNYSKGKFGDEITVIRPCFWNMGTVLYDVWAISCEYSENSYLALINGKAKPQEARSVLPNSLKTEIIMTANLREWRHVFRLRASKAAHPQMRQLMIPLLAECKTKIPVIFNDINNEE
jgi:thymidylate synthase (FAD)